MGMTIAEKIIAAAAGVESVKPGDIHTVELDRLMSNDGTTHLTVDMYNNKLKNPHIADTGKLVFIVDHNVPSDCPKTAASQKKMRDFAKANHIDFWEGKGVCHQIMMENYVRPGELIFGADSHTCSYGALGAFGTGVGCTDFLYGMVTGTSWVMVPETVKFNLVGKLPEGVYARDLILTIIGEVGANGCNYQVMEFTGEGAKTLTISDRIALCNMAVEAGAKTGIFEADEKAIEYLKEHVDAQTACVLIQHPNYYGNLEEAVEIGEITHGAGAKYVMNVNPISLGVVKTPAEYGADVAVGEGQPLGLSIAFGGPYLGFMAATQKMMRNLPGRIVGQTEDHNGKKGYVLTLQAREQHIRREKASSNICSNQALCALAVGVYLATMGNEGIKKAATLSTSKAHYLSAELAKVGYQTENKGEFFHEFVTVSDVPAAKALAALEEKGILGGFPLDEHRILWCCTEVNTKEEMDAVVQILKEVQ